MHTPLVSILIPTYNGADFLRPTIQSVLEQTYQNFELIIVDDASPDQTVAVIQQFDDPRLKYIVHPVNQGADQARYTALHASSGEIIAFLDQDDLFHPEKLQAHVAFYQDHPEIGFTYNARFELNYSAETIRDLWRPPQRISLADLVLWFPIAPSDAMFRRAWAFEMDLLAGSRGAEILHFGSLFLAGCKFGYIDRALNYRRHHSGRLVRNLAAACASELNNQIKIFGDPRCPVEVVGLRNIAHANIYLYWAYLALLQDEMPLGQEYLREAIRLKPSLLNGEPCELVIKILTNCIDDENLDHEQLLQKIFAYLPVELPLQQAVCRWAIAEGYLLKGTRAIFWQRPEDGRRYFERAAQLGAQVDEYLISTITDKLLHYEAEFGERAAQAVLQTLAPYLEKFSGPTSIRQLRGNYAVNRAFHNYHAGAYAQVPLPLLQAMVSDPKHLTNRGVLSMLFRSAVGLLAEPA